MNDEQLTAHYDDIKKQFKAVDERFDGVGQQFKAVNERFDGLETRFAAHEKANEQEFRNIESAFSELRAAVGGHFNTLRTEMGHRFDRVDRRFDRLEDKLDRALSPRRAQARRRRGNGK